MKAPWEAIKNAFARDLDRMYRFEDEVFHCEHQATGNCGDPYCEAAAHAERW